MRPRGSARRSARIAATIGLLFLIGCAPPERWSAVAIPTDADFAGIWFADSLNGWITGGGWAIDGGIVGRTRDGGRSWKFESGIIPGRARGASLGRVQFSDTLHGCVTASPGQILVTDDGGQTWRPADAPGATGARLFDVQFLDAWNGWVAGTEILRTSDAGGTWKMLVHGASENGYFNADAVHFIDGARGWVASHAGGVLRSDDGGSHWTPVALPFGDGEHPILWDITFTDPDHGWVAGEGCIVHTGDGGATWVRRENGVPIVRPTHKGEPPRPKEPVPELETEPDRLTVSAIQFADTQHGWAVGYYADAAESVVLYTADEGVTWTTERVEPGELLRCLFVLDARHAWAAGDRARTPSQVVLCLTPAIHASR